MPADTLSLRMRAVGGRATRRELDHTARSVRGVGGGAKSANRETSTLAKGMSLLETRMATTAIAAIGLTVALGPPMLIAIAALAAAAVALGAVFGGAFLLGLAAVQRFKETVGSAGSAAYDLKNTFDGLKTTFAKTFAKPADIAMRAVARGLVALSPLLDALRGPLTRFAREFAGTFGLVAAQVGAMGPQFADLLNRATPLFGRLLALVPGIVDALLKMASLGLPVLDALIGGLENLIGWFNRLLDQQDAGKLWQALDAVWRIIQNVTRDLGPMAGAIVALGLGALADAVIAIADHWKTWGPIIDGIVASLVILGAVMLIVKAAMAIGALLNPWTLLIAAVIGIGVALYTAYQRGGQFRDGVDQLWSALKAVASWVGTAFVDSFNAVKSAISWVVDKVKWLLEKLGPVTDKVGAAAHAVGSVKGPSGLDLIRKGRDYLEGRAGGGPINRSGPYLVGERGPEVVNLPQGANVSPNSASQPIIVQINHTTTLDGEVVARNTLRQAVRKRSLS
jgi:hypothetical protein